jgi:membrane protein Man1
MEEPEAKFARVAALKMADILHKRAVQYICGTKDVPSLAMSLEELRQMDEIKDVSKDDMKNVFYLVLVNPHWNIRWMNSSYKTVADWTHYPQSSDRLASSSHSLPFKCRFFLKLAGLWSMLQWIILAILGGVVVYAVFALYQKKKRRQESAVFSMVGRIMDVMKYHYKKSSTKKDLLPYLAIIHVRDMLIPPSERKAKEGLWDEAVQWIACNESRVRVETRRIAGQDFQVWRWIQEDPPPTEIPSSRQPLSPGGQQGRSQGNWHGSVFDHYPPEITTKVAPPTGTPSVCIRLKNMFEPIRCVNNIM